MSMAASSFNRLMRCTACQVVETRSGGAFPGNRNDIFLRDQLEQIQNKPVFLEGDEEDIFAPSHFHGAGEGRAGQDG